ncbi:MAG: M23 family metallopeptidase [Clostridia bacterium]|nr:M23 family metallopeptidase [Clostridia bacterium]
MDSIKLENIKVKTNINSESKQSRSKTRSREEIGFSSISIKIGLCIALCIALCIVNLTTETGKEGSFFADYEKGDDSPGKLRFVELPGIIEVFAGGDKLTLPVGEYDSAKLDDDTLVLTLHTKSNATVVTCASGTVKAIGEDEKMGNYVVIRHGDLETYYYGLGYITVEERQVINKLDTLGLLTHTGVMCFKVCKNGIPQNPCDYFPVTPEK